jgi:hypothetical protein
MIQDRDLDVKFEDHEIATKQYEVFPRETRLSYGHENNIGVGRFGGERLMADLTGYGVPPGHAQVFLTWVIVANKSLAAKPNITHQAKRLGRTRQSISNSLMYLRRRGILILAENQYHQLQFWFPRWEALIQRLENPSDDT